MLFNVAAIESENGIIYVSGSTAIGYIKGVWKAESKPVIRKNYNVELNLGSVERSSVIIKEKPAAASSRIINDKVFFTGSCEDYDKVYYLRFTPDGLEMLDIENDDFTIKKGDILSFSLLCSEIGIFPY